MHTVRLVLDEIHVAAVWIASEETCCPSVMLAIEPRFDRDVTDRQRIDDNIPTARLPESCSMPAAQHIHD